MESDIVMEVDGENAENCVQDVNVVKVKKFKVKRLQNSMEGNRVLSDATNKEIAFKMKRKRTPPKSKKTNSNGNSVVIVNKDTQCNFFHKETYNKGVQVLPQRMTRGVCTDKPYVVHAGTQTEWDEEEKLVNDDAFMKPFMSKLHENNQLEDFKTLVISMKTGCLPFDNIAWLCLLDRAKYSLCSTTTQMKYHRQTLEFWNIIYLMFGNSALTVFRGSANFSQVVTNQCKRGKYDPQKGSCNFSVPSVTTLKKIDVGIQGKIEPGFIEATLQMAEQKSKEDKQFTLSFDGKKIGEGLKELTEGDCNMLGLERPNVKDRVSMYNAQMDFAEELYNLSEIKDFELHRIMLQRSLSKVSRVITNIQKNIVSKVRTQNKLKMLSQANPNEKRFKFALSQLNVKKHECENNLKGALDVMERLLNLSARCAGLENCFCSTGYVDISSSPLFFELLPPDHLGSMVSLENDSDFIKQRSPLWFDLRKLACLTGSTMYQALGLEKFCLQTEHYDTFIKGLPQVFSADVRKKMDYGSAHEVCALATIVGKIIPGYFPNCSRLVETGMKFLGTTEQPQMLEVSADGMIKCVTGQNDCLQSHLHVAGSRIMVEIKCSYPANDVPHHPHDHLPVRYVTQCLAEMAAYECKSLLFVSWTPQSTAAFLVHFDEKLWEALYSLACEMYGSEKCSRPTKWHTASKELIQELPKFIQRNVRLLCVVPSVRGSYSVSYTSQLSEHHTDCSPLQISRPDHDDIFDDSFAASAFLKKVFSDCYHSLREPAQEVLVWMLSCKDRLQEKNMPNAAPVCYHMKGREFTMAIARDLRELVRQKLHERKVDVLCETYDGQFHPIIVRGKDQEPLTRIQLLRHTWKHALTLNKVKLIDTMMKSCHVSESDLQFLRASSSFISGTHATGNVELRKARNPCKLFISSRGGKQFPAGVVGQFKFAPVAAEDLARDERKEQPKKRNKQLKGVQADERNLIDSVHPELLEDMDIEEVDEPVLDEDELPDLTEQSSPLQKLLNNEKFNLLQDILAALRDLNGRKWGCKMISDLYPAILGHAENLYKECVIAELKVIAKVLKRYTNNRTWFDGSERKVFNVNLISSAFESTTFLVNVATENIKHNPKSLVQLSKAALMETSYATTSLRVSYADVCHKYAKEKWMKEATTRMTVQIPLRHEEHKLFCYPEYCQKRNQIECRTFDAVHVLTKVRGHLCRSGYTFAKKEAFHRIAREQPHILSRSIVEDMIDPQNAFIAERVISEQVEVACREMGFHETAQFLNVFRAWFRAMNARGLSADERCRAMFDMDCLLLSKIDLDKFPLSDGLQYAEGMPIKTFEAILQMNSTRYTLYNEAKGKMYNSRAVSTLPCESFFSDLTRCDREGHLYPKAPNISRLMGRCVTLNYMKHNPRKVYELCTSNKSAYPVHLTLGDRLRWETETETNYTGIYRNHFFDYQDEHPSQRIRREEVTTGNRSLRCVQGVRQWFRTDESKIDPAHRITFPIEEE